MTSLLLLILTILPFSLQHLTTSHRFIIKDNKRIKLSCVNWPGAHMNTFVPQGLHYNHPRKISHKIKELGFNCVRLNWSLEMFYHNPIVHYDAIKAIGGRYMRALDVYDLVVDSLSEAGVYVILDNHMLDAGWCCDPRDDNGLWFNDRWTAQDFEAAWEKMAERFKENEFVIGADLHNEVRPVIKIEKKWWMLYPKVSIRMPTWGKGEGILPLKDYDPGFLNFSHPTLEGIKQRMVLFVFKKLFENVNIEYYDWYEESVRVATKIRSKNPKLLIFSQGAFDNFSYLPSTVNLIFNALKHEPALYDMIGRHIDIPDEVTRVSQLHNLTGINDFPLNLTNVVYSSHFYPFFYANAGFDWDGINPTYEYFESICDKYWGNLLNKYPLWIGEFGTNHFQIEKGWDYVLRYMKEKDIDLAYWLLFDAKPVINKIGEFENGRDEYGLLDPETLEVRNSFHWESFKWILEQKIELVVQQ